MSKITSLSIVICFLSLTFVTSCGGSLPRRDEYVKILPMTDNVITYDEMKSVLSKHNIDIRPYYVPTPGTVIHAVVIEFDIDTLKPADVTYNEVSVKMEIRDGTGDSDDSGSIKVLDAIPRHVDKPVSVEEAREIAVNVAAAASDLTGKSQISGNVGAKWLTEESYARLYRKVTANRRSATDVSWTFRPFKDEPIFAGTYYVIALIEVRDQTREFLVHVHSECSYGRSTLFGLLKERKDCIPHEKELSLGQPIPLASGEPPVVPPTIGSTLVREKDGMEMVYVPGGTFQMGSTDAEVDTALEQCEILFGSEECPRWMFEAESPRHSVTLDSFWIDSTEVTEGQYAGCVAAGVCSPHSSQYNDYPVVFVNWYEARTYCHWARGRLPTEAEWEYAARGPDSLTYPWGNNAPADTLLNYELNVGDTTQVGSYPDGSSWVGAMDMAGNVQEWVNDWYDSGYYAISPALNPKGPEAGDTKVLRGVSWCTGCSLFGSDARAAIRRNGDPYGENADRGFRCCVDAPGE
jgi:formylglycine-generating enzyme required for sulfatase activity